MPEQLNQYSTVTTCHEFTLCWCFVGSVCTAEGGVSVEGTSEPAVSGSYVPLFTLCWCLAGGVSSRREVSQLWEQLSQHSTVTARYMFI